MCVRMCNYKPLLLCVRFVYIYNCIFCILGYYVYMLFPLFLSSNSTIHSLQLIGFAPTGACGCGRNWKHMWMVAVFVFCDHFSRATISDFK